MLQILLKFLLHLFHKFLLDFHKIVSQVVEQLNEKLYLAYIHKKLGLRSFHAIFSRSSYRDKQGYLNHEDSRIGAVDFAARRRASRTAVLIHLQHTTNAGDTHEAAVLGPSGCSGLGNFRHHRRLCSRHQIGGRDTLAQLAAQLQADQVGRARDIEHIGRHT